MAVGLAILVPRSYRSKRNCRCCPVLFFTDILDVPTPLCSRAPAVKADMQDAASMDQPPQQQCGQPAG